MLGTVSAIHDVRPSLPLFPRAIVEAVFLTGGSIGTADRVAKTLGLRNRFGLARLLKREGLPSLHRLAEWATVLSWLQRAERDHVSLCAIAFRSRRHPSGCYRLVKEVTGRRWEDVKARGSAWLEREFLRHLDRTRRSQDRQH